ncbi:pilin, partial [Patescibacteria group bacterium]|nr:pilin [Patescibacteria group bacterium]
MIKNKITNWLKALSITLLLAMSFSVAGVYADPGETCSSNNDCNVSAGEVCENNECVLKSLSEGGTGLSIPTGTTQISSDIVQDRTFGELVKDIVNYFIGFLGFLATLMFVYAGVLWVLSGGNEEQITKAKKIMTYAALGLIVVILSFSIVQFITSSAGEGDGGAPSEQYECVFSSDCPVGYYCNVAGDCIKSNDMTCDSNDDCESPKICDIYGFCRNPNANAGSTCADNTDCPTNYV